MDGKFIEKYLTMHEWFNRTESIKKKTHVVNSSERYLLLKYFKKCDDLKPHPILATAPR